MNLILEVVKREGGPAGAVERKVFGSEGGRIGRASDCDWVLSNPYISRHHATIRCINGTFYIESTGENGVAVNTAQSVLPQLERRALKNGDRLFIDEYEISVSLTGAPAQASASTSPPLVEDLFFEPPASSSAARAADPLEQPAPSDELDPLKKLMGGPSPLPTSPRQGASWNHSSSLADHFTPPPPVSPHAMQIAEDWNQTSFDRTQMQAREGKDAASSGSPAASQSGSAYTSPAAQSGSASSVAAQAHSANYPASTQTGGFGAPTGSVSLSPMQASGGPLSPLPPPPRVPPPSSPVNWAPPAARPPSATASSRDSLDLAALLRNAGVEPDNVPPETLAMIGTILRTTVDGLIDMLRARAEFRNQFRLPVTRVRNAENNPLKFAINAEDALGSLLGRRNPGYMPPLEAFTDAFDDMRYHQIATLAGMRAGFAHVMNRFDPERLQEQFDRHLKRAGFLPMATRFRYWELYVDLFEQLAGDLDAAFHRMFGEEFASAYEKQLEALKRSRSKPQR